MADTYQSFKQLEAAETKSIDYDFRIDERDSPVAIIAPHGGYIERHTTLIAEKIAGDRYNFYTFKGLKPGRPHGDLHITSTKFDEPRCVALVLNCETVVAIHGRADKGDPQTVFLGGLDASLRDAMTKKLNELGFAAQTGNREYPGEQPLNICNRGRSERGGVQVEIPRSLRDVLEKQPGRLTQLASAVVEAIESRR